jgi:hypothetical protein
MQPASRNKDEYIFIEVDFGLFILYFCQEENVLIKSS